MDIHDIPGVKVLNMEEFMKDKNGVAIICVFFITIALVFFIPILIDSTKELIYGRREKDNIVIMIITFVLIIFETIFTTKLIIDRNNLHYPQYEITLNETVSGDLYKYYTIKEQRGDILKVYPSDCNKADKYILEHESD